jgi:hypothetical protein
MQRWNSFKWFYNMAVVASFLVMLVAAGIFFLLPGQEGPALSAADASATSEAQTYATVLIHRQSTREAAAAASTAFAQATESARVESSATALAYANSTATRSARATIEAPPTFTAEAEQYLRDQAAAQATVQVLEASATIVFGPQSGSLAHDPSGQATCDNSGTNLQDFVAEARLQNPYAANGAWDYGFALVNPTSDDQARLEILLDSQQHLSVRLDSTSYTVEDRTTTYYPLDLTSGGSNLLKVYVIGDAAHVYVNNRYETTFDLTGVNLGNSLARPHNIMVCTGMKEDDAQAGKSTRYNGFTIWKVRLGSGSD